MWTLFETKLIPSQKIALGYKVKFGHESLLWRCYCDEVGGKVDPNHKRLPTEIYFFFVSKSFFTIKKQNCCSPDVIRTNG